MATRVPSNELLDVLREMALEYLERRPRQPRAYYDNDDLGQTPECLVVLTPGGGIPAFRDYSASGTGTGTGTGTAGHLTNQPGSAVCAIYRMELQGRPATIPELNPIDDFFVTVHNLMPVAIPAGIYVLVFRDKFGEWYVPPVPLGFSNC